MRARRKNVLVVCGGKSSERNVSLASSSSILKNLDPKKYDVRVAVIDSKGRWSLPSDLRRAGLDWDGGRGETAHALSVVPERAFAFTLGSGSGRGQVPDVVIPVLHGPNGEDGTVQGFLELAGVPYVGCGVLGSALAMDKEYAKLLAPSVGVAIVPYTIVRTTNSQALQSILARLGLPLFVKPARQGSSVGVSRVDRAADLGGAVRAALKYDDKVLVEKGLDAREIEVAVLGDSVDVEVSGCGEIAVGKGFYDYESKYINAEAAKLLIPAPLPRAVAQKARRWAASMFKALDGHGMSRVDFLLEKNTGKLYFNETNTIPGFTEISLYPRLWAAAGLSFPRLLDRLIILALKRHRVRSALKTSL